MDGRQQRMSELHDSNQAVSTSAYDQHEDSIENDEKHIMAVKETEDSFIVQYAKEHDEDEEEDMSETAKELIKDFLEVKSDLKAYDDDDENKEYGEFEGYGSVFGNKDLGNDVIEKGAFSKSITPKKSKRRKTFIPTQIRYAYWRV